MSEKIVREDENEQEASEELSAVSSGARQAPKKKSSKREAEAVRAERAQAQQMMARAEREEQQRLQTAQQERAMQCEHQRRLDASFAKPRSSTAGLRFTTKPSTHKREQGATEMEDNISEDGSSSSSVSAQEQQEFRDSHAQPWQSEGDQLRDHEAEVNAKLRAREWANNAASTVGGSLSVRPKQYFLRELVDSNVKSLVDYARQLIQTGDLKDLLLSRCMPRDIFVVLEVMNRRIKKYTREQFQDLTLQNSVYFLENYCIQSTSQQGQSGMRQRQDLVNEVETYVTAIELFNPKATDTWAGGLIIIFERFDEQLLSATQEGADGTFVKLLIEAINANLKGERGVSDKRQQTGRSESSRAFGKSIITEAMTKSDTSEIDSGSQTLREYIDGLIDAASGFHTANAKCEQALGKRGTSSGYSAKVSDSESAQKRPQEHEERGREERSGSGKQRDGGKQSNPHKKQRSASAGPPVRSAAPSGSTSSRAVQYCTGCGGKHHAKGDCQKRAHPHWNSSDTPWRESVWGLRYKKTSDKDGKPWYTLPGRKKITNASKEAEQPVLEDYTPNCKYAEGVPMCGVCNLVRDVPSAVNSKELLAVDDARRMYSDVTMSGDLVIQAADGSHSTVSVNVALDSQSVPSNFINHRVRKLLGDGAQVRKLTHVSKVCACFTDECRIVDEEVTFVLGLYDPITNKKKSFKVIANVIDSPQDVTLGSYALSKNETLRLYLNEMLILCSHAEACQRNTCEDVTAEVDAKVQAETDLLKSRLTVKYRPVGDAVSMTGRSRVAKNARRGVVKRTKEMRLEAWKGVKRHVLVWDGDGADTYHAEEEAVENPLAEGTPEVAMNASISERALDVADMSMLPKQLHGDVRMLTKQRKLCEKYHDIFSRELRTEAAKIEPMTIVVDENKWHLGENRRPQRIQSELKAAEVRTQVAAMLKARVIERSAASFYSQVLLVKKPNGTWRFCVDYRRLNLATKMSSWPIPNITQMLERLGQKRAHFYGVFDMTKGYFQAPLAKSSREHTAFITSQGIYQWNRVAMGLCGAPSYFQQQMASVVLQGLIYDVCEVYMDDIIVFGKTEEEYLKNLEAVMRALQRYNITANPDKCKLGLTEVTFVGHTINREGKSFKREKL